MLEIYSFIFAGSILALVNLLLSFNKNFRPTSYLAHVRIATVLLLIPPAFFILYKAVWVVLVITCVILSLMNLIDNKGRFSNKCPAIINLVIATLNSLAFAVVSHPGFAGGYC